MGRKKKTESESVVAVAEKPKRKRTNYQITPEQTVEVWEKASSPQEAAEALGMPKAILIARICNYRKAGADLKRMPRGKTPLDVSKINRLIETIRGNGQSHQVKRNGR